MTPTVTDLGLIASYCMGTQRKTSMGFQERCRADAAVYCQPFRCTIMYPDTGLHGSMRSALSLALFSTSMRTFVDEQLKSTETRKVSTPYVSLRVYVLL